MDPRQFRYVLFGIAAVSIACFVIGAFQDTMQATFAWAAVGAILPMGGSLGLAWFRRAAWRAMGKALGLRPYQRGAFPDLVGIRREERLLIGRRKDPYMHINEITVVRWGKRPEMQAPGLMTDAAHVEALLEPFEAGHPPASPEDDGARGGVDARDESHDGAAVQ